MPRYKKSEWSGTKQQILLLHMKGMDGREIAKKMGVHEVTVSRNIKKEEFQRRKEKIEGEIQEQVRKRFADKALWAVDRISYMAKYGKPDDRIRFDACKEILYQVGCKPVDVVESRTRDYTPEEVQSAMLVMKEVETITNRLSTKKSPFVLEKKAEVESTIPPAPCPESSNSSDKLENNAESSGTTGNS